MTTDNVAMMEISCHHSKCENYPGDNAVLTGLIGELIQGIEVWASYEEGVPDELWDAYRKAKLLFGEIVSEERR